MAATERSKRKRGNRAYEQHRARLRRRVLALRKASGLTQLQFALALGVTPRSVQGWETGETIPGERVRFDLERLFGHLIPEQGETTNAAQ